MKLSYNYETQIAEMGVALAELAIKGTATMVKNKIRASKEIKETEKLRTTYDAIVNEILQEREEAVSIAQAYKAEVDKISISDEDIRHLHQTISRLLDLIKNVAPDTPIESFEAAKELINIDTLKTMQLLGFNYKAAIGEPLTKLCASTISNIGSKGKGHKK